MSNADNNQQVSGEEADEKAPWHFKLLMVALVVYLAYRGVQMSMWAIHHFF